MLEAREGPGGGARTEETVPGYRFRAFCTQAFPTLGLGRWRTPVAGLYVSGAGTNPSGGILGTPGRAAARAVLRDDP